VRLSFTKAITTIALHAKASKGDKMAVPKRRVSKTRGAKRRTHYKVTLAAPVKASDGSWKLPHRINKTTGEYK
jgi:large subunit ribosomal protein L32